MIALAWLLAMAAATRVEVVDETYPIPADEWRYVEVGLKQRPAMVVARFETAGRPVRIALMRREEMERLRQGLPNGSLAMSAREYAGTLRANVPAGDYVLVVDNRDSPHRVSVHLRIWLDFAPPSGLTMTQLSPRRRLSVILISFAVFLAIAGFAGTRLLRLVRNE
jgi:hypothetical protein